uniref:Uncharacterized protein n=1 Tax=Tanacetum cinerariifolium TaxID=118510 RepID=A0A6L2NF42_TANCI|nr:hypothetical protein [Tanacetum cinerariifolium]
MDCYTMPRPSRPTIQDLYARMGHMEIRQGTLEMMSHAQSYHSYRCGSRFDTVCPRDWIRRIRVSWSRDHAWYLPEYYITIFPIRRIGLHWIQRIELVSFVVFIKLLQEMENPCTTMEEYVQFEIKKALRHGQVYYWEAANEGMQINIVKNLYVSFVIPFDPKLFYKDGEYTSIILLCDLVLRRPNIALPPRNERHTWLRKVHMIQILDFTGLAVIEDLDITERLKMQHRGANGEVLFTTSVWRDLLRIRRSLVREVGAASKDPWVDPEAPQDALVVQEDVQADLATQQAPQVP